MVLVGLIAFIAGMIAGFISMRAMGWMCVAGLLFVSEARASWTVTMNVNATGGALPTGGLVNPGCYTTGSPSNPSSSTSTSYTFGPYGYSGACNGQNNYFAFNWTCTNGTYGPFVVNADGTAIQLYAGGACGPSGPPPPCYSINGCITNTQPGLVGYYISASDGFNWYSGPLASGQGACVSHTNCSAFFTYTTQEVFYNSDGGTNNITVSGPNNPGTNAPVGPSQPPSSAPGNPIGGGPGGTGGGSGVGNNTNLTGGQFAGGVSNLIDTIIVGDQVNAGLLSKIAANTSGTNNQIDYRGYLITLTNQGQGHLTMLQTLTNQAGGIYTQVVQVADLSKTNFSWMTNTYAAITNGVDALTNAADNQGFLAGVSNDAVAFGKMYTDTGGAGSNTTGLAQGTNFGSGTTSRSLFVLGIHTNTLGAPGLFNLDFTGSNLWVQLTPWLRLLWSFIIFVFCASYIHYRIQEEVIRLGMSPGSTAGSWNWEGGIVQVIKGVIKQAGKYILGNVALTAFFFASIPALLGVVLYGVLTIFGGTTPSMPLSDAGMATAGTYSGALELGYTVLKQIFPFELAMTAMVYLGFFEITVGGIVAEAQRAKAWIG